MRLFTIRACVERHEIYQPEEGIYLSLINKVPCLTPPYNYKWISDAMDARGVTIHHNVLPVVLGEKESLLLKNALKKRNYMSDSDYVSRFDGIWREIGPLKYASLHKDSRGVSFLQQDEDSKPEDRDTIVSLEVPLSAAQPYYEFEGDVEILLGIYATYYGDWQDEISRYEVEKEDALCCGIIRVGDQAKVSVRYTNRFREGKLIETKKMVGRKFEFICHDGQLMPLDLGDFRRLFSDFQISE